MGQLFANVDIHYQYKVLLNKIVNSIKNSNSLEELRDFDAFFSQITKEIPQAPNLLDSEPSMEEAAREKRSGYIEYKILLKFEGSKNLFYWIPSSCALDMSGIYHAVSDIRDDSIVLCYEVEINHPNPNDLINQKVGEIKKLLKENLLNLKRDIDGYFGNNLKELVIKQVSARILELEKKEKILTNLPFKLERKLSEAIKIERNIVEKSSHHTTSVATDKTYSSYMSDKDFKDVLTLISNINTAFERLPKTFALLDEPTIRDFLLVILQSVYSVVVGEAFNGAGKTDILIKHDRQNIFIAECKKWKGELSLTEAFEQLFGYVDTRLSKAAIIIFDENKNHQNTKQIISKKIPEIQGHQSQIEKFHDYGSIYKFTHPADSGKEIHVAVLSFHKPLTNA